MVSRWNNRTGIAIAWLLLTAASAPAQVLDPYATVPSPTLASSASTARTASGYGSSAVGASVLAQPGGEAATGLQPTELPPANNSLARSPSGYFDLDSSMPPTAEEGLGRSEWTWQLMPSSLIYKSYLAGAKEPRLASQHVNIKDDGWVWDVTLGSRVGLLRYGDRDPVRPNGFQIDMEGAAMVRLDVPDDVNVRSVDFRGGMPLTWGMGRFRTKFGYYHLSSHLGDEFLLGHPGYNRLNYSRDCLVLGETVYLTDRLRVYAETAWAFHNDICKPWEFQFGVDYSPVAPTGLSGAPFFAVNGHLRQEVNYGGTLVVEAGWAWLSDENSRLFRMGMQYLNGQSIQYSFYHENEQAIGLGLWYDF